MQNDPKHDLPLWRYGASARNWPRCLASWALKENIRYFSIWRVSILSPQSALLLMLASFWLAGAHADLLRFMAPGAVAAGVMFNAFLNAASSLCIQREDGAIADLLMSPLSPLEMVAGNVLGGVGRGMIVGVIGLLLLAPTGLTPWSHPLAAIFGLCLLSLLSACAGSLFGFTLRKTDDLMAVLNFGVTPLSFLSLTWVPITQLPDWLYWPMALNPFAGPVELLRYGLTGAADLPLVLCIAPALLCCCLLFITTTLTIRSGRWLKD